MITQQAHGDNWLYIDMQQDNETSRVFRKEAYLPDNAASLPECTDAEKRKWEEDHPQPEPEPSAE